MSDCAPSRPSELARNVAGRSSSPSPCSLLEREELKEARALVLECARKHGELDAKEGVTIPPAEFCEDTKVSKMLRAAWLQGWHSANKD